MSKIRRSRLPVAIALLAVAGCGGDPPTDIVGTGLILVGDVRDGTGASVAGATVVPAGKLSDAEAECPSSFSDYPMEFDATGVTDDGGEYELRIVSNIGGSVCIAVKATPAGSEVSAEALGGRGEMRLLSGPLDTLALPAIVVE